VSALGLSESPPGPTNSILMAMSTLWPLRQAEMEVLEAQRYMNMDERHALHKAFPPLLKPLPLVSASRVYKMR
jgi:hypothetical protein